MANTLTQLVRQEVENFFAQIRDKVFNNEHHLQAHLHLWLSDKLPEHEGCKDAKVHIEYYVPMQSFYFKGTTEPESAYPWKGDRIYVDLVVECDGQFVPIEMKYKTEKIEDPEYTRFGSPVGTTTLIANMVATNQGYYECWKDVKRLELLAERFPSVEGGLFVFLTNNHLYLNKPKNSNCVSRNFAWNERTAAEDNNPKVWPEGYDSNGRHKLDFAQGYAVNWNPTTLGKHYSKEFRYCIIEVDAQTVRAANHPPKVWHLEYNSDKKQSKKQQKKDKK